MYSLVDILITLNRDVVSLVLYTNSTDLMNLHPVLAVAYDG